MSRHGLRPRWGLYASNITDAVGLAGALKDAASLSDEETKERLLGHMPNVATFISKDKAESLKNRLSGFATIELKRVMVSKGGRK